MSTRAFLRIFLRILAGIVTVPPFLLAAVALFGVILAIGLAVSSLTLTLWAIVPAPWTFLYGCFIFATENTLDGFRSFRETFKVAADPTGVFCEVVLPTLDEMRRVPGELRNMWKMRREVEAAKKTAAKKRTPQNSLGKGATS